MEFFDSYKKWEKLSDKDRESVILACIKFYENKTVEYILSNLPKNKRESFKKEPVRLEVVDNSQRSVEFGDNVVYILKSAFYYDKKDLFFMVAKNTICAVFANLFKNTTGNKRKKTKFGELANGFLASITSEFAKGAEFEADMMQEFAVVLESQASIEQ